MLGGILREIQKPCRSLSTRQITLRYPTCFHGRSTSFLLIPLYPTYILDWGAVHLSPRPFITSLSLSIHLFILFSWRSRSPHLRNATISTALRLKEAEWREFDAFKMKYIKLRMTLWNIIRNEEIRRIAGIAGKVAKHEDKKAQRLLGYVEWLKEEWKPFKVRIKRNHKKWKTY